MKDSFSAHIKVVRASESQIAILEEMAVVIAGTFRDGGKLYIFGNGGSAADAQHIAAEFVGRFKLHRRGLPAIALTTDTSSLTAIANDFSYDDIFARQMEALLTPNDVVWALSTSGSSKNIIKALMFASVMGCYRVGFTGKSGAKMQELCDICFMVPHGDSDRIQEVHQLGYHCVVDSVEKILDV